MGVRHRKLIVKELFFKMSQIHIRGNNPRINECLKGKHDFKQYNISLKDNEADYMVTQSFGGHVLQKIFPQIDFGENHQNSHEGQ